MDVPPEGDPLGGEWVWWFPSHYRRGCISSPVFFVKKTVQNPDSFEFFISPLYSLDVSNNPITPTITKVKISMKTFSKNTVLSLVMSTTVTCSTTWTSTFASESKTPSSSDFDAATYGKILRSVLPVKKDEHSFCYMKKESNKIVGINKDTPVRLASTTKLLTTNWAIQKWGPDYRMSTVIEYDTATHEAFIANQLDPFFGSRRMYNLISELNQRGIYEFSKLKFSKDFMIFLPVENPDFYHSEVMERQGISDQKKAQVLMDILNVANWSKERIQNYEKAVKSAAEVGMSLIPYKELRFKVGSVEFSSDRLNAMVPDSSNKKIFISKGAPVKDYMKQINKFSMNYPADVMFLALGGAAEFKKFMAEKYKADMHDVNIAVGSGLYTEDKNGRFDGTATCALMVEVIASMKVKLKTENYDLKDVMMVGGIDQGTTFGLYNGSSKAGAVITKTGTLRNAITYAGELKTKDGDIYFGAFFQSAAMPSARAARNKVVAELFSDNGGPKAIKYKSPTFRPFDAGSKMYEVMQRNSKSQIKISSNP